MNSKAMKLCAIAIVAAFVVTAFAVIPADSSAADDSSKTYFIHFEEVDSNYTTVKSVWIQFQAADTTWASFQLMANIAFKNYNIDEEFNDSGWLTGYGGDCSTWFVKDGKWTDVEDGKTQYISTDTIAIVAGPGSYIWGSEPPAEVADKYYKKSDSYYLRLPCVAVNDFGSSDHKTYHLHFDIVNTPETVDPTQSTWLSFEATDSSLGSFVAAANSAFALYRIDAAYSSSGYLGSTTFGANFTAWVCKDSKWATVSDTTKDYSAAKEIAIIAGNGSYIWGSEPPASVKDKYTYDTSMEMYVRNPSVDYDAYLNATKTYNVVFELIADDSTVSKTVKFEFDASDKDNAALLAGINEAFVKNGVDVTASITTYFKLTGGSFKGFSTWFTTDGKEWTYTSETLTQYISAEAIAIEGGPKSYYYGSEPPAEVASKYWKDNYDTYHFIPETAADFYKSNDSNNNLRNGLIIGGVVAVILIAAVAFFFVKKN